MIDKHKKRLNDYSLTTYVRVICALHHFIHNEDEFRRVKQRLMEAAFDEKRILEMIEEKRKKEDSQENNTDK